KRAANTFLFKPRLGDNGLGEVAQCLDQARFALLAEPPSPGQLWAESLSVLPGSKLLDTSSRELPVTLARFYKIDTEMPKGARLRLQLFDPRKKDSLAAGETLIVKLPQQATLPLRDLPEGDHLLRAETVVDGKVLAQSEQTISFVGGLSKRLAALEKADAAW